MFALNQDKLTMEMDKETFSLLISIINMKITVTSDLQSDKIENSESNDNEIYSKIYERCRELCKKLIQSGKNTPDDTMQVFFTSDESNQIANGLICTKKKSPNSKKIDDSVKKDFSDFNPKLLAMECLLTMNLNKQHHDVVDWFKSELRESDVFGKIIDILKYALMIIKHSKLNNKKKQDRLNDEIYLFFIRKYNRYLNFIETIIQSSSSTHQQNSMVRELEPQNKKKKLLAANLETSVTSKNQIYILEFKNNLLLDLIKESLLYFYDELIELNSSDKTNQLNLILNSIKEIFLLMINLTHNNGLFSLKTLF